MAEQEVIGFIGLGVMGKPMAHNLLRAGYSLAVHNRSRQAVEELSAAGARPAHSAKEIAESASVVILMLPDSPDVEAVVEGPEGLLETTRDGTLILDMSTISPRVTKRLAARVAERGGAWVDAPVSGGDKGAREGTLSIMVGATDGAFAHVRPILETLGKTIVHLGPVGAGQTAKAANQIVVGVVFQALGEALFLTERAGLNPEQVVQVLQGGLAHTRCLELRQSNILSRQFDPGFRVKLHHKDLGIALDTGEDNGVPLPATALVHQFMGALIAQGKASYDHSALITIVEGLAAGKELDRDR